MKVWTLELERTVEEDFGGFQYHTELHSVHKTEQDAELTFDRLPDKGDYTDYLIRSWEV